MPGSYAHITLVNLASEKRRLLEIEGFPREAVDAANLQSRFLELGSISPDYPYLDVTSGDSKNWADAMHYTHTCQAIYVGAELVRGLTQGLGKEKCLAWLMGYTAHVITDMCIHPVVELKVGPYESNATEHRRCEMHQDVFIFPHLGTGMPQTAEHLRSTILTCGAANNEKQLDPDVKGLWGELLRRVHPTVFADDPPDMDKWHQRCCTILEKLLPTSSRFVGFARHVCDGLGFSYPAPDEIKMGTYIKNLIVPSPKGVERRMHYNDIFDLAIACVQKVWIDVTRHALGQGDFIAFRNDEWDLDTGRNKLAEEKGRVFWEVA
ncbi:MAG: zinc dependent phospholipase C family protein [Deltaproteobacteria bacterium]|nr:zinc dependent phospholipase C family protein [Deltaproteobacteria bacterium]